jgi:hypothetical protein
MGVYMGWLRYVSLLVLFALPASFATIIVQSGDEGAAFANETSARICQEPGVEAVFVCSGNVVRAVSQDAYAGSTFYKPNGKVVSCPPASASSMGAECVQMMAPNYCPSAAVCGASEAPEHFPGLDSAPVESGVPAPEPAEAVQVEPEEEPAGEPEPAPAVKNIVIKDADVSPPVTVKSNLDTPLAYLVYVVLFLGVGAVGVLFMLFKNSLADEGS